VRFLGVVKKRDQSDEQHWTTADKVQKKFRNWSVFWIKRRANGKNTAESKKGHPFQSERFGVCG
jgi:hypothetical protein